MAVIEPTTDRGRRLAGLAQRLRAMHADLAEQPAEMRKEQLHDEVQRTLAAMPPTEREPFLSELMSQFPQFVDAGVAPAPAMVTSQPLDAPALVERLATLAKGMSDKEREAIAQRLTGAGFALLREVEVLREVPGRAAAGGGDVPEAAINEFRKALGLLPDAPVDAGRAVESAAMLAEFVVKLEPWACSYWRELAPDAKVSVYQTVQKDIQRYVGGDDKINKEAVAKNLYKLRSLVSLLMKAVLEAGKQFARDHIGRFSVDAIKQASPKETFKSDEYRYWKQYERLMEGVDAPALEKRLKQVIARDVDAGLSQVVK